MYRGKTSPPLSIIKHSRLLPGMPYGFVRIFILFVFGGGDFGVLGRPTPPPGGRAGSENDTLLPMTMTCDRLKFWSGPAWRSKVIPLSCITVETYTYGKTIVFFLNVYFWLFEGPWEGPSVIRLSVSCSPGILSSISLYM